MRVGTNDGAQTSSSLCESLFVLYFRLDVTNAMEKRLPSHPLLYTSRVPTTKQAGSGLLCNRVLSLNMVAKVRPAAPPARCKYLPSVFVSPQHFLYVNALLAESISLILVRAKSKKEARRPGGQGGGETFRST